jgi:hypothetical protein
LVFGEQAIRDGDVRRVPLPPISRLVAGHQQDGPRLDVEGEEYPYVGSALRGARPELLHVGVLRSFEGVDERSARDWSVFLQLLERRYHVVVFLFIEVVDPRFDEGSGQPPIAAPPNYISLS